uniref:Uncharacterized protein MANES_14G169900 n=1 Tax=Rhizophora mucronata TaxID=61149 RepID=A0A2P2NZK0_RHIMU
MLYCHNIRVTKQSKKLNFPKNTCCIRYMLKNIINLLYCDLFSSMSINGRANNTITPFTNDFLYLILSSLSIFSEEFCFC